MEFLKLFQNHTEYDAFVSGGTMVKPNVSHCIQENEVHYNPIPHDYSRDYLTFVALEDGQFGFITSTNNVISYSIDEGRTWTELERNSPTPTITAGNKIMWKGELQPISESVGIGSFGSSGSFDVQGNVMSLLYGDEFEGQTNTSRLCYLFCRVIERLEVGPEYYPCEVVNAKNLVLPATTLTDGCYVGFFTHCASLITPPQLPATTLVDGCYASMFLNCTSLTTAPELPATTLAIACYANMFSGCTSLVTAPELPATTLAENCYYAMFQGCTVLTTAPQLPATTLAESCYSGMFAGCTSLTTAPVLSATTLAASCYHAMFGGCTSLTTAPVLSATTLAASCYHAMFAGCTSLTTAPVLSATTLVDGCYGWMFDSCTSLATAPELPATTLAQSCYEYMFNGCTSLNYIKAMFTTTPSGSSPNYYTTNWVDGVAASGRFVKACDATWNVSGVNGIPEGWTVEYQQANGEPCQEIK